MILGITGKGVGMSAIESDFRKHEVKTATLLKAFDISQEKLEKLEKKIINGMVNTLEGTCTVSVERAVENALFNLLADTLPDGEWRKVSDTLWNLAEQAAPTWIERGIIDRFYNYAADIAFGECAECGWWATDCYHESHNCDGDVCFDCAEYQ